MARLCSSCQVFADDPDSFGRSPELCDYMQRFKDRERPAVLIGPRDRLFPPPQENSGVTSESGGAPFGPPPPITNRHQRDDFACGSPVRPTKGLAPLVPSQQCRPPCTHCQPEEGEEEHAFLKDKPPEIEGQSGLPMRQQSEFTLQAPAASEDSDRPSSSPPSTARRPSRALCVPHSTRTGFTHIDHDRQNDFALRLSLADAPPLLDATLQLALAVISSLFDDAMLELPLDDVLSLLDASL